MALELQVQNVTMQANAGVVTQVIVNCLITNVAGMNPTPQTFVWTPTPTEQTTLDGWWTTIINKLNTVTGVTVISS